MKLTIHWFRRDLRLADNTALSEALESKNNVLPIFIFDEEILSELRDDDPRVNFIYDSLKLIDQKLKEHNSSVLCLKGKPFEIWKKLIQNYSIESVYTNKDYEPYAKERDLKIKALLKAHGIEFLSFKDQVIYEEQEIVKNDGSPYTMFTPYKNKWLRLFTCPDTKPPFSFINFYKVTFQMPSLEEIGFQSSNIRVRNYDLLKVDDYAENRDLPINDSTSYLGPHLRFGTISVRHIISQLKPQNDVFLSELIWREFFIQILHNYPHVVHQNFRSKYDGVEWLNNNSDFEKWCNGRTGYPMVDAGMRQLNETGYMHNRVRMITAGFLCKHLLIDWRWGEAYFAKKLLDYELSSNNGNWQWAAGTGCDAAPYFRIFNPMEQLKKFDKDKSYIKKWITEYGSDAYPEPMVEHTFARSRALKAYQIGMN
ncbi:MAG: deoxyribodipyrimidine photo-lyase [Bacteroidetes bacterium]|nr:deoxyribodipyrimidine photo-lyase [Bacteroidota bacterium]